jgi:predicted nucleotidyltransferase
MPELDLEDRDARTIRRILEEHLPELSVRAFGSRVKGTARRTSDLDLVLMTEAPIDLMRMAELKEAFTESDLPFKVDLLDRAATSEKFWRLVEPESVLLRGPAAAQGSDLADDS